MFVGGFGGGQRCLGGDQSVLPERDGGLNAANHRLVGRAQLLLNQPEAVVGVENRELRLQPDVRRLAPQDLHAQRVERTNGELVDRHLTAFLARRGQQLAFELLGHALAHFGGGLVREGHGGDVLRLEPLRLDQPGDLLRDDARLAAARPGQHETWAVEIARGFVLSGIEREGGHGVTRRR